MLPDFPAAQSLDILAIALLLLVFLLLGLGLFILGWWIQNQRDSPSPYTGSPLKRGEYLSFFAKEQILKYLYDYYSYENPLFKLKNAALCRETGRIFPNALTWYNTLYVDWNFLNKRYKGQYVSWGSLTLEQQDALRKLHGAMKGYQTAFSSRNPSPRLLEPMYAYTKPGPLYVDVATSTLLGWKCVPGTDYEVLIVQKPPQTIMLKI